MFPLPLFHRHVFLFCNLFHAHGNDMKKHTPADVVPPKGSFFGRVYAIVARIPPGRVMTYGQISALLDNDCSARYVGFAMSSAPAWLNLPCHRVVNRRGETSPDAVFGGKDVQRKLLEREGVKFTDKGRIDLSKCLFLTD